ncbi:MAG: helix-turn-helix domain-containing protein [Pseudomonadota bacterium]
MSRLEVRPRSDAAGRLKQVACRLFAQRGVDGVTVREIAEAAGQKNHAAVGYHFGSKEALIRELVLDGAVLIDRNRNAGLDALEAAGGPTGVREIADLLIATSIGLEGSGLEDSYNRFIVMLAMTHREVFMNALDGRWNSGYQRCLDHLRRLMPDMPAAAKNERLVFMGAYLGSVVSAREAALADTSRDHRMWDSEQTLGHFAATITALIEAPF